MAHPEHQRYWFMVGSGCGLVGLGLIALAGALSSSTGHLDTTSPFMIMAYVAFALTVACFVLGVRQWGFPIASRSQQDSVSSSAAMEIPLVPVSAPQLPPPPVRVILRPEQDGQRLRLVVVNRSDTGTFSAEVVSILDHEGQQLLGPQSWPIPWLEDGSVDPKIIQYTARRILDFARYDAKGVEEDLTSTHWGGNKHWWFSSLPEPIGFMYHPVRTRAELEAQRFLVTVRIIRTERANSTDRQFAIGVSGFDLICKPVDE